MCRSWTGGLENDELARVPLHIAKRCGFKSNRTNGPETNAAKAAEEGRIKADIQDNERLLREGSGGSGYWTVGEMIQKDSKFANHKLNKAGDYSCTVTRAELEAETKMLFESQRGLGNPFADGKIEKEYRVYGDLL